MRYGALKNNRMMSEPAILKLKPNEFKLPG
jgi:hypothetical protein